MPAVEVFAFGAVVGVPGVGSLCSGAEAGVLSGMSPMTTSSDRFSVPAVSLALWDAWASSASASMLVGISAISRVILAPSRIKPRLLAA